MEEIEFGLEVFFFFFLFFLAEEKGRWEVGNWVGL